MEKNIFKSTINKIKKYKEFKADIVNINIAIKELEEEVLGVAEVPSGERTGKTYKITSSVEKQQEIYSKKRDRLLRDRGRAEREIQRVDNAMTILREEERDIVQVALIDNKKYAILEMKYNRTYCRIKQIETEAVKKMSKYL